MRKGRLNLSLLSIFHSTQCINTIPSSDVNRLTWWIALYPYYSNNIIHIFNHYSFQSRHLSIKLKTSLVRTPFQIQIKINRNFPEGLRHLSMIIKISENNCRLIFLIIACSIYIMAISSNYSRNFNKFQSEFF